VVIDDFDSDGNPDLAVSQNVTNSSVTLLLGNGAGSFTSGGSFPTGHDNNGLASGDFNKDGKPDVAVAASSDNKVDVLLANAPTASRSGTVVPRATPTPPTMAVVPIGDRTPPTQTISFPRQTVASVLRDGLIMFASCSEPCGFRADVQVKSSTKKPRRRHGRAARMVTAGAANAALGTVRRRVVVRIRKSARTAITRSRRITLTTTATDTVGNASRVRRGLKLRRR
jgi:hypothetical protein